MKIFDIWDTQEVKVEDPGLKRYIVLNSRLVPKSRGRERERFAKAKVNLIERLINKLQVPGHRGKKHKIQTKSTGKFDTRAKNVINAFKIIEKKTKQNPIAILVKAIENAAYTDETTTIEYGGARYLQAVDTSPLRRLNTCLRNLVHGAYDKAFKKKINISQALATEILAAYEKDKSKSFALAKKIEMERQADAAR
ncbi:30S ribosomal protein S7 [Candidatus Pacearchaeota archaeon ex4484_26]|nr:MAG: 30S ribosomal protein S7 [Candidatus Pacearchaeota archaeon ex4484_26]